MLWILLLGFLVMQLFGWLFAKGLLWLLPQLVVWPLLFLLAASGIGAVVQAARRLYRLPKK